MNLHPERKIKYIQITRRILEEEGQEGVTIRRVAKEAGCTSAVLYKHFDSREHLITLASVEILESYTRKLLKVNERKDLNSLQMDLLLWKLFIEEALYNKPFYEMLFFEADQTVVEDCIFEYYDLFPEKKNITGYDAVIAFNVDLLSRELVRLNRAANEKLIKSANAVTLGRLNVAVFKGMFREYSYQALKENPETVRVAAADCYGLIRSLFKQFALPGAAWDIPDEMTE